MCRVWGWSDEVMALFDVLDEAGVGGLPAQELLRDGAGMLAFAIAVERWMTADNDEPFALHAAAALSDLQVRAAELDSRSPLSA